MTSADNLKLQVFRGASGLAKLAPAWNDLAESLPSAALIQYPQYYLSYVDAFDGDARHCMAVAAFSDGDLVAVMPVAEYRRSVLGVTVRVLRFPNVPMRIRDVCLRPDITFQTFLDCLTRDKSVPAWDYLHFRGVMETSPIVDQAHYRQSTRRIQRLIDVSNSLDCSQENYVDNRLNSKARNNLRRGLKKLAALGEFAFTTVQSMPALEEAFGDFLETEAAGWKSQRGGKRAVKLHKDYTAFYRDLMRRAAVLDRCHIHLLSLNGKAIASDFSILVADRCYSLKHGFDEAYAKVAPSNLLRQYALERYCSDPAIRRVELVSGAAWHSTWRPIKTNVFDVQIFNRTVLGQAVYQFLKLKTIRTRAH